MLFMRCWTVGRSWRGRPEGHIRILLLVSLYKEEITAKQSTFSRPNHCNRTFLNDDTTGIRHGKEREHLRARPLSGAVVGPASSQHLGD